MKRAITIGVFLLLASGCGELTVAPTEPEAAQAPAEEAPEEMMTMEGISLYLSDTQSRPGASNKPRLAIHAERFDLLEGGEYSLEGTKGQIFDEAGEETLSFEATSARVDEAGPEAILEGEVVARSGDLRIDLDSLRWHQPEPGKPGLAESDGRTVLSKDGLHLEAEGLKLRPDSGAFELWKVRGNVSLKGIMP